MLAMFTIIRSLARYGRTDVVRTYFILWSNVKKVTTKSILTEMWSSYIYKIKLICVAL